MRHKAILLIVIFLLMIAPISQCNPPGEDQNQDNQPADNGAPDSDAYGDTDSGSDSDAVPDTDAKDEETEAQKEVLRLYDIHGALVLEVEWMVETLHPAATTADLEKIWFFSDAKGDKKYSVLSKTAGVDVPQNEIVGWGYMMLSNFLPGGLPPDEVFPCDEEVSSDAEWLTVCMEDRPNNPWGDYFVVYTIHDEPIEWQDQTYNHSHSVVFDSDGLPDNNFSYQEPWDGDYFRDTDRQYEALYDVLDQGRWRGSSMGPQFSIVPSDARFVFKGSTVFTLIPTSDFSVHDPAGRVTTFLTTGGFAPEDCGYDTNGEDPRDNLVPFTADPIYIGNEQALLTGIVLDGYTVKGSGCTLAQKPVDGGQKTMLWCDDNGCKGNGGACKLFNRLKGDSPQDEDSWNYVADGDKKMQKDANYEYHCFCVK